MSDSLTNPGGFPPCFKHSGSRIGRQRRSSRGGKGPGRNSYRSFVATGSRDSAQKEEQDRTKLFQAPELNEYLPHQSSLRAAILPQTEL